MRENGLAISLGEPAEHRFGFLELLEFFNELCHLRLAEKRRDPVFTRLHGDGVDQVPFANDLYFGVNARIYRRASSAGLPVGEGREIFVDHTGKLDERLALPLEVLDVCIEALPFTSDLVQTRPGRSFLAATPTSDLVQRLHETREVELRIIRHEFSSAACWGTSSAEPL
ncbi:MAG: hypothetical protein GXP62_14565 [Oligoflexia bacterium]|nr:hypothetical protein [Oligoflexia bacterium]